MASSFWYKMFGIVIILLIFSVLWSRSKKTKITEALTHLEKIYGNNCPRNPHTMVFDTLLRSWDEIACGAAIPYSISYGSYLGWFRHQDYIPYDEDVDVHIGRESVSKLMALKEKDYCCESRELKLHPFLEGIPRLVLNPFHENKVIEKHRPRYNCNGDMVSTAPSVGHGGGDDCAFNALIARLIYPGKKRMFHLDISVYHREDDETRRAELEENGLAEEFYGPFGSWIPSYIGSPLPPVQPCRINGIKTSCFRDGEYLLESLYGKDFMKPNKMWSDGWVEA